ncbi:hypothetical protein OG21DRAFT_46876 [Imleria badia]|nr:hypothetical protein OG21DRAFT_46876 [Imleria badia]
MSSSSRYASALRRGRSSDVQEKIDTHGSWPIPPPAAAKPRRVRVRVVIPTHLQSISWLGRRGLFSRCCAFLGGLFAVSLVLFLLGTEETNWTPTFRDSTLVFSRHELQRIWRWEIDSGFTIPILNPALPPARAHTLVSSFTPPHGPVTTTTCGIGPQRTYHTVQNPSQDHDTVAYPPRPISGSIADFDIILDHCNFVNRKVSHTFLSLFRVAI